MIILGDCLEKMKEMEDNSIDFIVTDPPYGLTSKSGKGGFMGKEWDGKVPGLEIWQEALRVCKPGSMLAAFGGSRTHHHLMLAIEGAGWEIRDCVFWIQGQGFPKSHNFGNKLGGKWQGYGTALKPSYEPIIICEKPYEIISLFIIILMDITNEIYKCQKFNSNVKDVELDLSDSLLLLDKVQQSIVQDHAKTSAWEKLSDVNFVIKNFISLKQELKERINQEKDLFARTNAKDNGKKISSDQEILLGKAGDLFANIQDIVTCVSKGHINQNIVLSWKNILIEIFQEVNKFTIEMVINLITGLRILKYYLLQSTSKDTGNLSHNYEPIILAMKPLEGTFRQNAEKWGVAGINIDESRISIKEEDDIYLKNPHTMNKGENKIYGKHTSSSYEIPQGRWPANLILSEEAAEELDQMAGILKSSKYDNNKGKTCGFHDCLGRDSKNRFDIGGYSDSGGASRFFYCAKASSSERNKGLEGMPLKKVSDGRKTPNDTAYQRDESLRNNTHPTVKPIALMRYLLKLLAPPGNPIVLDPFAGSGSTLVAAKELGIRFIGIEKEPEYHAIAEVRVKAAKQPIKQLELFS